MISIEDILIPGDRLFYHVSNADGKVWLLPAEGMRTGLQLYQPSGIKGRMLKRLFPLLHRLSPVRRVIHAETLHRSLISLPTPWGEGLQYSIFGGTPSVHQKITIQFFRDNLLLGYAKLTDSEDISLLFKHEQQLLDWLRQRGVTNIPECLECRKLDGGLWYFLQTTVKTADSVSPAQYTRPHVDFLKILSEKTLTEMPFEESDFAHTLSLLEGYLHDFPVRMSDALHKAVDEVHRHYDGTRVRFSAYHADFTPWNMFITPEGGLYVFDWEYGRRSYPPMLDRYHFVIQQAIHVSHLEPAEIMKLIKGYEWYDDMDMKCYLLDMISRWTDREKGKITPDVGRWLELLPQ